jgi:predicted RNA-binding Zn-ribbon protein involved in translation (DUF1610 family)
MTSSADAGGELLESRLRLKRVFLQAMIASLVTSALIAVGILLFGEFNQTTNRILGTLGVLAVHSGIATACADMLERRLWPTLSRLGIAIFSANFVVFVTLIWLPAMTWLPVASWLPNWSIERESATTAVLIGYFVLAIPPAALRERGRWLPIAYSALGFGVLGFGMALVAFWAEGVENEIFVRLTGVAAVYACSFSHTCLLGFARGVSPNTWIVRATGVCIWIVAAILSHGILVDDLSEFRARIAGAAGVLDACGSLTLVILARLKRVQKVEQLQTSDKELELVCPRCTERQVVRAGNSKCRECGLKFRIEIEEPRCARCGYLLWQLTERRCPECGETF